MKRGFLNSILLGLLLTTFTAAAIAKGSSLLDMSDQLDGLDKQDFQESIDRANACTRARNFSCSESELTKAAKAANSGQDKKTLAAARQNIVNEKAQIAAEERQRAEEARRAAEAEERRLAAEERARERERQAQRDREEREQQEASRNYEAQLYAQMQQNFAQNAELLANVDRQTNAAMADSRRIQAAQAAERERARAEREERAAEQRREAERAQEARAARAEAERQRNQQAEQDRAREQERRQNANTPSYAAAQASGYGASSTTSGEGAAYARTSASSANSPDKWEKKYKWTNELTISGHDPKSQDAACNSANEKVDRQNFSDTATDSKVTSRGSCACRATHYPMPPFEIASYDCTISIRVERASIYSNAGGASSGVSR